MNEYKLERIKERRAELKSVHSEDSGLSLLEFTIETLIEAEDKLSKINAFAQAIAVEKEKMRAASGTNGMAWRIASDAANSLEQNLIALVLEWIES